MTDLITATDVRALKHADSLCFDHLADGTGRIRAILDARNSSTGFEQTHTIIPAISRVQSYAEGGEAYTAFAMIHAAKVSAVTGTLVRHLRLGTEVALVWTRDNNNNLVRDAGLHVDQLSVRIGKPGRTADEFLIYVSVCADNTARMIKVAR